MVILKTRMAIFGECGDVAAKGFTGLGQPHADPAELAEKFIICWISHRLHGLHGLSTDFLGFAGLLTGFGDKDMEMGAAGQW